MRFRKEHLLASLLGLCLAAGAVGCGSDDNGEDPNGNNTTANNNGGPDVIDDAGDGMVDGEDGMDDGTSGETGSVAGLLRQTQSESDDSENSGLEGEASGYVVTANQVSSDGSLESITATEATTDSDARYNVEVMVDGETVSDFIVRAEKEEEQRHGEVIVSQDVEADGEVTAAPMTVETAVESDAYVGARSTGAWGSDNCSNCTTAQFRTRIEADLATDVDASSEYESDVESTGESTVASMQAWNRAMLEEDFGGASESDLQAALDTQTEAVAQLAADLDTAADDQEREDARDTYMEAVSQAYADANIETQQRARAAHPSAESRVTYASELSADAQARARSDAEQHRARLVTTAVTENYAQLQDASSEDLSDANSTLMSDLEAAAEAGADAESEIQTAWENYSSTVKQETMARLEAEANEGIDFGTTIRGELNSALDAVVQTYTDTLADLSAENETSATADTSVSATADLWSTLTADTNVELITGVEETAETGISEDSANAALEILAHVTAASKTNASAGDGS